MYYTCMVYAINMVIAYRVFSVFIFSTYYYKFTIKINRYQKCDAIRCDVYNLYSLLLNHEAQCIGV